MCFNVVKHRAISFASLFKKAASTSGEYEMDRKRTKTRHSFVRKNLSIDMTISSGDNADMDSEEEASYQIELEIMKPDAVDDIYKFQNILQKVSDLSKLISV